MTEKRGTYDKVLLIPELLHPEPGSLDDPITRIELIQTLEVFQKAFGTIDENLAKLDARLNRIEEVMRGLRERYD